MAGSACRKGRAALAAGAALACLCWLGIAVAAVQGDVRARLGAATVALDESVSLTVEAYDVDGPLDTSALEADFDVVVRSRATRYEVVDGSRSVLLTFVLELSPRVAGVYTVPPVRVGNAESAPLTLEVLPAPTGAARDFFMEAGVDRSEPFVQAQTILTLGLWFGRSVLDLELEPPRGDGLVVEPLGDATRRSDRRDGRDYEVLEQRYAVFAQFSGRLELEPGTLNLSVPADPSRAGGMYAPARRLARRAAPIALDVRPRPAAGTGWWLPATGVTLDAAWSGSTRARVGEPLTRTISLRAEGVRADQLPEIPSVPVAGASVHADTPESAAAATAEGLVAERRTVQAIIPQAPGPLVLPAVEVTWFDTRTERERVARLEPVTLEVAPSARAVAGAGTPPVGATGPSADSSPGSPAGPGEASAEPVAGVGTDRAAGPVPERSGGWRIVAFTALAGWTLTALVAAAVWYRRRLATRANATAAGAPGESTGDSSGTRRADARRRTRALVAAVRNGSPAAVKDASLALAAERWPAAPPATLPALAARLDDRRLRGELLALDAGLYGRAPGGTSDEASGAGDASPDSFADRLAAALPPPHRPPSRGSRRGRADAGLPPL